MNSDSSAINSNRLIAVTLITVAATMFAGSFAFLFSLVSGLKSTALVFAGVLFVGILVAVLLSIFFGGRGIAYGIGGNGFLQDRFHLQALFGLIAILLSIVLAILYLGFHEPTNEEKMSEEIEILTREFDALREAAEVQKNDHARIQFRLEQAERQIEELQQSSLKSAKADRD